MRGVISFCLEHTFALHDLIRNQYPQFILVRAALFDYASAPFGIPPCPTTHQPWPFVSHSELTVSCATHRIPADISNSFYRVQQPFGGLRRSHRTMPQLRKLVGALYNEMVSAHFVCGRATRTEDAQALVHCVLRGKCFDERIENDFDHLTIAKARHTSRHAQIQGSGLPNLPLHARSQV